VAVCEWFIGTTLAGWVADFISVCLETRWLGQKPWFLLPGMTLYHSFPNLEIPSWGAIQPEFQKSKERRVQDLIFPLARSSRQWSVKNKQAQVLLCCTSALSWLTTVTCYCHLALVETWGAGVLFWLSIPILHFVSFKPFF